MACFHVHGSEVQGPVIPGGILVGNRRGDVVVNIHHQGSSFSDGGQSTIAIPEDGVVETKGLGHNEEISPLTYVEPSGHGLPFSKPRDFQVCGFDPLLVFS